MSESRLSSIMRVAWKTHRLDAIREVVTGTIVDLCARDPREVMGRSVAWSEELASGPMRAALDTCCDELRDGCGLPVSGTRSDRETGSREANKSWTDRYAFALARYRESASVALEVSFGRLPVSTPDPALTR